MSDPIAEAAAQMSDAAPSSTEPVAQQAAAELPNDAPTLPAGAATPASTGNVLANAAPLVDAPNFDTGTRGSLVPGISSSAPLTSSDANAVNSGSQATGAEAGDELPRESHLMLLEAKIAAFRAKLANAERVALDEFEAIVGHVRAVL
jgi:hypothetical protein